MSWIITSSENPNLTWNPTSWFVRFFFDSTNSWMASIKLDDGSVIPLWVTSVSPDDYLWTRNPNTNTPTIVSTVWIQDQFYIVSEDALADVGIDNIGTPKAWSSIFFDAGSRVSGTAPTGTVQSVNGKIWIVTLNSDEIPVGTTNLYLTSDERVKIADAFLKSIDTSDDITESATKVFVTPDEKTAITHSNRAALDLVQWENTGDQDLTPYLNKTTDDYLEDIVEWDNITIDKTDPKNPIINASGGTPFLRSQFRYSTLNIVTSDLLAESLNRTQMFYTGENTNIVKVNVRCFGIGTNPNGATMNLTVNWLKVLATDLTLATWLTTTATLQNTALVDWDEIKWEVITATGSSDVLDGYVEIILW